MDGWMGMQAYTASRIDSVVEENWQDPVFQAQKANTVRKNVLFAPFTHKNDLFTKTGSGQISEKRKETPALATWGLAGYYRSTHRAAARAGPRAR